MNRSTRALAAPLLAALVSCASCGAPEAASHPVSPAALRPVTAAHTEAPVPRPRFGAFGFDTAGMDRSIKPGDDFHEYASARWRKAASIPADRTEWGTFEAGREASDTNVRSLLEEQSHAHPGTPRSASRKATRSIWRRSAAFTCGEESGAPVLGSLVGT